jgi:hypothetical protein
MPRLLDPLATIAVILGSHDWTKARLPKAVSFRHSAAHWLRYLLTEPPYGLGLEPDLVLNLFDDPSTANSQLVRIRDTVVALVCERRETAHPIRDVLIYYVGHGTCEGGRHLHLLVRDSNYGIEEQSSIGTPALAHVLRVSAPQQRRLVILDCCFSEAAAEAFGAMASLGDAVATTALRDLAPETPPPERGTLVFCSSPRQRTSIGLPNAERTLFTGALLSVLREGLVSNRAAMLSFSDLREETYDRMLREYGEAAPRPALHQPDQQAGDLTRMPAFYNVVAFLSRRSGESQGQEELPTLAERQAKEEREAEAERRAAAETAEREAEAERRAAAETAEREAEAKRRAAAETAEREAEAERRAAAETAEREAEAERRAAAETAGDSSRLRETALPSARSYTAQAGLALTLRLLVQSIVKVIRISFILLLTLFISFFMGGLVGALLVHSHGALLGVFSIISVFAAAMFGLLLRAIARDLRFSEQHRLSSLVVVVGVWTGGFILGFALATSGSGITFLKSSCFLVCLVVTLKSASSSDFVRLPERLRKTRIWERLIGRKRNKT